MDNTKFYFPEWFNPHSVQTMSTWLVSYLEENIKQK